MIFETENIEFKAQLTDGIYKEIIAFANTDGGTIYIGIDDDGNAVGIDNFEEMRSMKQELTFSHAEKAFRKYHVEFSKEKYRALGIRDSSDSLYTNLALVLSDQCSHTIKVAVFGNDANTQFRDSREFSGSVFEQLEDTFSYLVLCNKTVATFKGLERIECADYPEEALREALLNAIVHRDYSFSGSIIININDNEMEFISIGGLLPGLSPDDIRSGISQPRNKNLAEVFHRLHLIESYGTGIRKIYSLYGNCALQPRIEVTTNTFKMILPNMNRAVSMENKNNSIPNITPQMQTVLDYIDENGQITDSEVQDLLDIKSTRSYTLMKKMANEGLVLVNGRGANKKYLRNTPC